MVFTKILFSCVKKSLYVEEYMLKVICLLIVKGLRHSLDVFWFSVLFF